MHEKKRRRGLATEWENGEPPTVEVLRSGGGDANDNDVCRYSSFFDTSVRSNSGQDAATGVFFGVRARRPVSVTSLQFPLDAQIHKDRPYLVELYSINDFVVDGETSTAALTFDGTLNNLDGWTKHAAALDVVFHPTEDDQALIAAVHLARAPLTFFTGQRKTLYFQIYTKTGRNVPESLPVFRLPVDNILNADTGSLWQFDDTLEVYVGMATTSVSVPALNDTRTLLRNRHSTSASRTTQSTHHRHLEEPILERLELLPRTVFQGLIFTSWNDDCPTAAFTQQRDITEWSLQPFGVDADADLRAVEDSVRDAVAATILPNDVQLRSFVNSKHIELRAFAVEAQYKATNNVCGDQFQPFFSNGCQIVETTVLFSHIPGLLSSQQLELELALAINNNLDTIQSRLRSNHGIVYLGEDRPLSQSYRIVCKGVPDSTILNPIQRTYVQDTIRTFFADVQQRQAADGDTSVPTVYDVRIQSQRTDDRRKLRALRQDASIHGEDADDKRIGAHVDTLPLAHTRRSMQQISETDRPTAVLQLETQITGIGPNSTYDDFTGRVERILATFEDDLLKQLSNNHYLPGPVNRDGTDFGAIFSALFGVTTSLIKPGDEGNNGIDTGAGEGVVTDSGSGDGDGGLTTNSIVIYVCSAVLALSVIFLMYRFSKDYLLVNSEDQIERRKLRKKKKKEKRESQSRRRSSRRSRSDRHRSKSRDRLLLDADNRSVDNRSTRSGGASSKNRRSGRRRSSDRIKSDDFEDEYSQSASNTNSTSTGRRKGKDVDRNITRSSDENDGSSGGSKRNGKNRRKKETRSRSGRDGNMDQSERTVDSTTTMDTEGTTSTDRRKKQRKGKKKDRNKRKPTRSEQELPSLLETAAEDEDGDDNGAGKHLTPPPNRDGTSNGSANVNDLSPMTSASAKRRLPPTKPKRSSSFTGGNLSGDAKQIPSWDDFVAGGKSVKDLFDRSKDEDGGGGSTDKKSMLRRSSSFGDIKHTSASSEHIPPSRVDSQNQVGQNGRDVEQSSGMPSRPKRRPSLSSVASAPYGSGGSGNRAGQNGRGVSRSKSMDNDAIDNRSATSKRRAGRRNDGSRNRAGQNGRGIGRAKSMDVEKLSRGSTQNGSSDKHRGVGRAKSMDDDFFGKDSRYRSSDTDSHSAPRNRAGENGRGVSRSRSYEAEKISSSASTASGSRRRGGAPSRNNSLVDTPSARVNQFGQVESIKSDPKRGVNRSRSMDAQGNAANSGRSSGRSSFSRTQSVRDSHANSQYYNSASDDNRSRSGRDSSPGNRSSVSKTRKNGRKEHSSHRDDRSSSGQSWSARKSKRPPQGSSNASASGRSRKPRNKSLNSASGGSVSSKMSKATTRSAVRHDAGTGRMVFESKGRKIYEFEQSEKDITIFISAPSFVKSAKELSCNIRRTHLQLGLAGSSKWFIDEDTFGPVEPDKSSWTLGQESGNNVIFVYLRKVNRGDQWETALHGKSRGSVKPVNR